MTTTDRPHVNESTEAKEAPPAEPPHADMVWVPGGTFHMGSNDHYPEEAPVHPVTVDGFWMDARQTTNREFARFVEETGYVTLAEEWPDPADFPGAPVENLVPGSLVFQMMPGPVDLRHISQWWVWTPDAHWRKPEGSGSSLAGREDHPVVHLAYRDVTAYCEWAGKELPTEAEWERAARGGLEGAEYVWGEEHFPGGKPAANTWQGEFPWQNLVEDGFDGTAPVGSFSPNGYGLYDMAGNAWDWTVDWWSEAHPAEEPDKACCTPTNPRGGDEAGSLDPQTPQFRVPRRVVKGGSYLCAPNYCLRYRPSARRPQHIDTGTTHIGFRGVVRVNGSGDSPNGAAASEENA